MASSIRSAKLASSTFMNGVRKWYYNLCGFNKFDKGLYTLIKPPKRLDQNHQKKTFLSKHVRTAARAKLLRKNGLMYNDILYEDQDVKEALKRLPEKVLNDRNFRISRALHLSMKHRILPKEEWTKYEEEVPYLQPYLDEVIRERKEREEWMKK